MPNSNPSRNAKYLSNAQLCHAFSPKNHPLDRAKTHFLSPDRQLMPTRKDQSPPDLRYFESR
jgi:hypothetical protein